LSSEQFIKGIKMQRPELVRSVDKSDYHNHACLAYHLDTLRSFINDPIPDPPDTFEEFELFIDYLVEYLHPHLYTLKGFEFSIDEALKHAEYDGVTILEMSVDAQMMGVYGSVDYLTRALDFIRDRNPNVNFRPEIGVNRLLDADVAEKRVLPMIESGYFNSIDLYGDEKEGAPEKFQGIYKVARSHGMILKAHAGEYCHAEFVRHSVEILDLDEVQHGIAAAESQEVMAWLADRKTVLHVCPTSNVRLERVSSMEVHPLKKLFDNGVGVTVNSDDIMVFNAAVSDEYQNLYDAGLFSAGDLDEIRLFGLGLRS
jgi:adenosine deaminase